MKIVITVVVALALLLPSFAQAEAGCFALTSSNPQCSPYAKIECLHSYSLDSLLYGSNIASLCHDIDFANTSWSAAFEVCSAALKSASSDRDLYLSQRDTCANNFNNAKVINANCVAVLNKGKSLEKKLRRACGAKCKKIK